MTLKSVARYWLIGLLVLTLGWSSPTLQSDIRVLNGTCHGAPGDNCPG